MSTRRLVNGVVALGLGTARLGFGPLGARVVEIVALVMPFWSLTWTVIWSVSDWPVASACTAGFALSRV